MQRESDAPVQLSDAAAWIAAQLPPDADLDRPALNGLAVAIGRERRFWADLVRHDSESRFFLQLYRDVHVDVWLQGWVNQQDTGFHDHDLSSGAVYVCEGVLAEDRFQRLDGTIVERTVDRPAGRVFDFDAAYIHRIRHPGGEPATSIHVYSPALWRMGYYELDEAGNLSRNSITYADEMGSGRGVA